MAYSPSQTAMARASIVGQAAGNIQNLVINASQNIGKIIKQKDVNKKIDAAYKNAVDNFVQQAVASGIDETSARIKSQHFFRQLPMEDIDPEIKIKNLLASGMRAEEYLSRMQASAEQQRLTQQKATSAQAAVSGGREYGMPSQIGAPGGTFTEQTVTETAPPAQYQEEAMGTYAQMAAEQKAPIQTTKELQQQPAVAALPKRPEPPKPMTEYQKALIKAKNDANDISRMKAAKGDTKQIDKNLQYLQDRQDDIEVESIKNKEKHAKLRQARVKINANKKLSDADIEFLTGEGIDATNLTGPQANMKQLDDAIKGYSNAVMASENNKIAADEMVKGFLETQKLSTAISRGRAKKQQSEEQYYTDAIDYIQSQIAPTLSMTGTVKQIMDKLPEEYKPIIQEKIDRAKRAKYSDFQIKEMLTRGTR